MAMSSSERQKKFTAEKKKQDLIRVSFWIDRKTWERFTKYKTKNGFTDWSSFLDRVNRVLVSVKFTK